VDTHPAKPLSRRALLIVAPVVLTHASPRLCWGAHGILVGPGHQTPHGDVTVERPASGFHAITPGQIQAIVASLARMTVIEGKPYRAVAVFEAQVGSSWVQQSRPLGRDALGRFWQAISVPTALGVCALHVAVNPRDGEVVIRHDGAREALRIKRRTLPLAEQQALPKAAVTAISSGHQSLGSREVQGLLVLGERLVLGGGRLLERWHSPSYGIELSVETFSEGRRLSLFRLDDVRLEAPQSDLFTVPSHYRTLASP